MKKILFCASTISHIENFHLPYLKAFRELGYEVHVLANESIPIKWADQVFALPFEKSIFSPKNFMAIFKARKLIKEQKYEKLSANTSLAGIIIRIAALFMKARPYIYYISHGYLFNLNSGLKKYIYLIPEKLAANVSDVVMVMNQEDSEIARKYKLFKNKLYYINGMGVDSSRIHSNAKDEKAELKRAMGFASDDFLFVYAAEFSRRKNQKLLIDAFLKSGLDKCHLLLAGNGKNFKSCLKYIKRFEGSNRIHLLGFVTDVPTLYRASDVAVSSSLIEGLPFNIIEAIGCGLPVVVSNIKGHSELVEQDVNGLLFKVKSEEELIACLQDIYSISENKRSLYGQAGIEKSKKFLLENVQDQIMSIYTEIP